MHWEISKTIHFSKSDRAVRDAAVEWLSREFSQTLGPYALHALELRSRTDNLTAEYVKRAIPKSRKP